MISEHVACGGEGVVGEGEDMFGKKEGVADMDGVADSDVEGLFTISLRRCSSRVLRFGVDTGVRVSSPVVEWAE